ncbi:MAG TPA: DUF6580 family putative transport protein [Chitinophagaceae bacterium]|jgi:branched-subunit amino acid transport protein AzlD
MKNSNKYILVFVVLTVAAALYRVWDSRPFGFAPQIAMAIFAGAVIPNKRLSFLVPLLSMLLSDVIYQVLYMQGLTDIKGFYEGQWVNYVLFTVITVIGFFVKKNNVASIVLGSICGVVAYFLLSNFSVWIGGGLDINNQPYPKNFSGLMNCYEAALPFLRGSLWATLIFNGLFFGIYSLYDRYILKSPQAIRAR